MTDAYGHRVQAPRTKAIDKVVSDGDFGMGKLSRGWSETSHTSVSSRTYSPTSDRSVTFGDVEVCEFLPTIGDNPSVSSGVPVALSFDLERRTILRLDSYEENRSPRRKGKSLMIPREVREDILRATGFQQTDIAAAVRESRKLRHKRLHSYNHRGWDSFHATLEGTTSRLKKIVSLGGHKESGDCNAKPVDTSISAMKTSSTSTSSISLTHSPWSSCGAKDSPPTIGRNCGASRLPIRGVSPPRMPMDSPPTDEDVPPVPAIVMRPSETTITIPSEGAVNMSRGRQRICNAPPKPGRRRASKTRIAISA